MNQTYLLIGGNMGNRKENMQEARQLLSTNAGDLLLCSSLYETEAWGMQSQPAFLNQVLLLDTKLDAAQLLEKALDIEMKMGRVRTEKFGPRTIDIDILFFGEAIIHQPGLTIPHPQLHLRRFTLEPLNEIAPTYVHPVFHKTVATLLRECNDPLVVKKL